MKFQNWIQFGIILIGLSIGLFFSRLSNSGHTEGDAHGMVTNHSMMAHGQLEISDDSLVPKITYFEVTKDPMQGWNLYLEVDNFRFAPEHVNTKHRVGEGHAHLYVNGQKIARLYANWYYIAHLPKGTNEIKVGLNTNAHQQLVVDGKPIEQKIVVDSDSY